MNLVSFQLEIVEEISNIGLESRNRGLEAKSRNGCFRGDHHTYEDFIENSWHHCRINWTTELGSNNRTSRIHPEVHSMKKQCVPPLYLTVAPVSLAVPPNVRPASQG